MCKQVKLQFIKLYARIPVFVVIRIIVFEITRFVFMYFHNNISVKFRIRAPSHCSGNGSLENDKEQLAVESFPYAFVKINFLDFRNLTPAVDKNYIVIRNQLF